MTKKLQTQEILEMISKPNFVVRYMLNPYLLNKKIFLCDYNGQNSVMRLETDYFINKKILEIFIQYNGKTVYRMAHPNAKWHRPVVSDMLKIYDALKNKSNTNQK